ncbi:hypothetical protein roselon_02991 [Roseibacterium elongatum DSM 19469]|uniref:Uncharacterized protein n=2 Tax=Roseicyclus elongatus TaxID=159346 RepID=W8S4X3_9RHOB|nr:hypothetical protein roselon_02991 [Roseibacterium elongatum DSM 19469]
MTAFARLSLAALCALPLSPLAAQTPGATLTCDLTVVCLGVAPCRDWDQSITLEVPAHADAAWVVTWPGAQSAAYDLVADLPAPEGSLRPARIRTLVHAAADTQAVQIVTLSDIGHVAVTMHQPHVTPPVVTAGGTCPALIPEGGGE